MAIPAAPSDLFAESTDAGKITIHWKDNSSDETSFKIERSPTGGGVGFVQIDTKASSTGTGLIVSFTNSGLANNTRFFYRVRASNVDGDSAFTNEASAITQICTIDQPPAPFGPLELPRAAGGDAAAAYDDGAQRIEDWLNQRDSTLATECKECSSGGAVVLDFTTCCSFTITLTEDINSISMINHEGCPEGELSFIVPAGANFRIGGFPSAFGMEGNEARTLLNGGADGLEFMWQYQNKGPNSPTGPGGPRAKRIRGAGGKAKSSAGAGGPLTLTCGNSNCSIDCDGVKSLVLTASGGTPPYTFSTTGGNLSCTSCTSTTLTPPTNSNPSEPGTAYTKTAQFCQKSGFGFGVCNDISVGENRTAWRDYGCNDTAIGGCSHATNIPGSESGCAEAFEDAAPCLAGSCTNCGSGACTGKAGFAGGISPCDANPALDGAAACDRRTGAMIAAGCVPCGSTMDGKVVTVTDAATTMVSKTIRV